MKRETARAPGIPGPIEWVRRRVPHAREPTPFRLKPLPDRVVGVKMDVATPRDAQRPPTPEYELYKGCKMQRDRREGVLSLFADKRPWV